MVVRRVQGHVHPHHMESLYYRIRITVRQKEVVPTVESGVIGAVDWCLAFSKVFVVPVFVVHMLGEPTRRAADFPTGGNKAWPALHGIGEGR